VALIQNSFLWAQAKISVPASSKHFTVNWFTEVSHNTSLRLLVPCNCALKLYTISWLCQNLSNLALNVSVVLAEATQLGKLFHVFATLFEKLNFHKSYLTWDFWSLKSFPLVRYSLSLFRVAAMHVWYFPIIILYVSIISPLYVYNAEFESDRLLIFHYMTIFSMLV